MKLDSRLLAAAMFAASVVVAAESSAQILEVEGLPPEASREGTVITVDVAKNEIYLFQDGELVRKSAAATGTEKVLRQGSRLWLFRTPRGRHQVQRKIVDPVWRKPDWAFVEEGKRIPPADSPKRLIKGKLGRYALDLGDGILIHGTDDPSSIGKKASHGCIRVPDEMLALVYRTATVGTDVHIFETWTPEQVAARLESRRSDLDF